MHLALFFLTILLGNTGDSAVTCGGLTYMQVMLAAGDRGASGATTGEI